MAVVVAKGVKYDFEINFEIFLSQILSITCQVVMESLFNPRKKSWRVRRMEMERWHLPVLSLGVPAPTAVSFRP